VHVAISTTQALVVRDKKHDNASKGSAFVQFYNKVALCAGGESCVLWVIARAQDDADRALEMANRRGVDVDAEARVVPM
jgi:hypothetical protein